ncbi:hypothetical protein Rctr16k_17 [Virus Rctr16k]|nr:hypothetical protein Rctr16k_17 [Virus Rctr16k]
MDELRPAPAKGAAQLERDASGRFVKGNRAGAARRVRAGKRGALVTLEKKGDAAARAALAFGRRYASHRRAELARAFGEISAGVGAMVESAGELLAAARYWSARGVAEANPDHARLSATLIAGARQAERDAWALAQLEEPAFAKAKKRRSGSPWLVAEAEARPLPALEEGSDP